MYIRILVMIMALLSIAHSKEDTHYQLAQKFVQININAEIAHKLGENQTDGLLGYRKSI